MKIKLWSPVLAVSVIIMSGADALGQSQSHSIKVTCETRNGIPTTIATASEEKSQKVVRQEVFHWQANPWFHNQSPEQLCQEVSKKLQSYYDGGGRGSSFNVHETAIGDAICVESTPGDSCSDILLTMATSYSQDESKNILDSILDSNLKTTSSQERGDHRRINRVDLFQLLLKRFLS